MSHRLGRMMLGGHQLDIQRHMLDVAVHAWLVSGSAPVVQKIESCLLYHSVPDSSVGTESRDYYVDLSVVLSAPAESSCRRLLSLKRCSAELLHLHSIVDMYVQFLLQILELPETIHIMTTSYISSGESLVTCHFFFLLSAPS